MATALNTARTYTLAGQRRLLSVDAGTGFVTIDVLHDAGTSTWVTADVISSDGVRDLYMGHATIRITPSGDATFCLH